MIEEQVIIVDENDNVIGSAPRSEVRAKKLWHRATSILVFNSQGEIFIHQRSFQKDSYPGLYDTKVGGVLCVGESYYENAVRELQEELGVRDVKLQYLFNLKFSERSKVFHGTFKCVYDGPIVIQKEEILHGKFVALPILKEMVQTEKFTRNGIAVLQKYLQEHHETPYSI